MSLHRSCFLCEGTNTDIRVIGTTRQQSSHVLQMRHDLPEAYRCTLWECLAPAEHSTCLPVCMAVKGHPDAYSRDQEPPLAYDPDRAADAFLRLDTLAELKRFIVDTKGEWQGVWQSGHYVGKFNLCFICNPLTRNCYNGGVWTGEDG